MPTPFGEQVLASRDSGPHSFDTMVIDGQPASEFLKENHGKPLFEDEPEETLLFGQQKINEIANNFAWNKAQEDALMAGDIASTSNRANAIKQDPTIQDTVVDLLLNEYSNKSLTDYGVLDNLVGMEPEEQINRILHEVDRLDAKKLQSRQHLLIHMLRSGYAQSPVKAAQEVWMSLNIDQLQALGDNMRQRQVAQLRAELDAIVAPLGTGFTTSVAIEEILQQDFIPVYGAITRIVTTKKFLPDQVDIGTFRGLLPGEVRKEIREWFAQATHEDRLEYVKGIKSELERVRTGPNASHFTRYGILENVLGIFTDDLLEENISKDTLDRVLGNLDVLLEVVYAAGVTAKLGSSVEGLFRSNNSSSVRQAAHTAGNTDAVAELDLHIRQIAEEYDLTTAEASIIDLPRPPSLRDNMEVLPDGVKDVLENIERLRPQMLRNSDIAGEGLTDADKANVIRDTIKDLDWGDTVHVNHRMMTVGDLDNGAGVRITAVLGETPTSGWRSFDNLVKEVLALDDNLRVFEIVRRGAQGTIESLGVTANEIAQFATKGIVPARVEARLAPTSATSRLFGGRRLSIVPKDELLKVANEGDIPKVDLENILDEIDHRKAGTLREDPLRALDGDEFYLRVTQDRDWHSQDKSGFNAETFLNTGILPKGLVAPNGKFGDDIYGAFTRVYFTEGTLVRDFNTVYKPYYDLSTSDKLVVENIFEWAEDFAKSQADQGLARAPTYEEIMTQFDGLTVDQMKGYAAIREGLNIQYEMFNRRLYRDMHTRGLVTARSTDGTLPNYHGTSLETVRPGSYFDPVANEMRVMDQTDIQDIYNGGGGFVKLDFAIDSPSGGKFDTLIVRSGDYEIGELSTRPLNYYEGYHMRFYQDPVYIVRHTKNATINGKVQEGEFTEAIRTAGSTPEAERFLTKFGNKGANIDQKGRYISSRDPNVSYEIKAAKNINNTEGTLFQQQALYREGRMFWDSRNLERLPDVNGNRAKVQDLTRGLQKGTAMAVRQTTHEDLINTLKTAFGRQYSAFIDPQDLATKDLKTIIADLRAQRTSSTSPVLRKTLGDAIELAKYIRIQIGTDSAVVPMVREGTIAVANWIGRLGVRLNNEALIKLGGFGEQFGQQVDPFRFARSVAFHAFIVFRPVRQLLLQSAQVSYLLPLDPTYIGTGRIFKDSLALRRGIKKMTTANYVDGWSDSHWAKSMGLSKKEYQRLVEEFHRSGLLESVDVHTFNPSSRNAHKIGLRDTVVSKGYYYARDKAAKLKNVFQAGFDLGEKNNLTFTYMIALRRGMDKAGVKSLTKLSRSQWDAIKVDASNLALAMTRPNKFGYQGGAIGTTLQFLSFGHKALLGMIGRNPSITKAQGLKIALSTYAMFGANMFGAEDWAREQLAKMGLTRKTSTEVLPGITIVDILSAGLVEAGINAIGKATSDEWKDLNLGFLAPGANVVSIYEQFYETLTESPATGVLGPFANPASGFLKGAQFTINLVQTNTRPPAEKFMKAADTIMRHTFPGYNDANRAYLAYTMGVWKDKDGDRMPLRPVWNTILARGLLGVRSLEESAYYKLKEDIAKNRENIENAVKVNKEFLKELLTGLAGKEYGDEYVYEQVAVLNSFYDEWPEGQRREIFIRSLTQGNAKDPSIVELLAEAAKQGGSMLDAIIPWIEEQEDLSAEERLNLTKFINEAKRGRDGADELFKEIQQQDIQ